MTVHHVHKDPNGCTETDCGEINTYGRALTVSDDWAMVTCEICRAKKGKEQSAGLALPCPWCGMSPVVETTPREARIACYNAECPVKPSTFLATRYDALKVWNSAGRKEAAERARLQQSVAGLTKDLNSANDKNLRKEAQLLAWSKEIKELTDKLRSVERLEPGAQITENRMRNEIRALIQEELARTSPAQKPAQIMIGLDTWMFNKKQLTELIDKINQAVKDS